MHVICMPASALKSATTRLTKLSVFLRGKLRNGDVELMRNREKGSVVCLGPWVALITLSIKMTSSSVKASQDTPRTQWDPNGTFRSGQGCICLHAVSVVSFVTFVVCMWFHPVCRGPHESSCANVFLLFGRIKSNVSRKTSSSNKWPLKMHLTHYVKCGRELRSVSAMQV